MISADMKQKITISTLSLILLIVVMLVSLAANLMQYERATSDIPLPITGSYCTNAFSTNCTYLVFDKTESYTLYNQTDGVLEQGSYAKYIDNQYSLTGDSGVAGNVILTEDGLYYIPADATVTFFQRFSDIPTYIGSWVENADMKA